MKLIKKNKVKLEKADQNLAAFLEELKVLRAKYPEIKFGGISYEAGEEEAVRPQWVHTSKK